PAGSGSTRGRVGTLLGWPHAQPTEAAEEGPSGPEASGQAVKILPSRTSISTSGNGDFAGPPRTAPSARSNLLPWHRQGMCPSVDDATKHPLWEHSASKARNSPSAGWVTTVPLAAKTWHPPTGTSE